MCLSPVKTWAHVSHASVILLLGFPCSHSTIRAFGRCALSTYCRHCAGSEEAVQKPGPAARSSPTPLPLLQGLGVLHTLRIAFLLPIRTVRGLLLPICLMKKLRLGHPPKVVCVRKWRTRIKTQNWLMPRPNSLGPLGSTRPFFPSLSFTVCMPK